MERGNIPDYAAKSAHRYLIAQNVLDDSEKPREGTNHCVVFCKKVAPNIFDISKGVAVVCGEKNIFNDGICMIAPETKVVFVFE